MATERGAETVRRERGALTRHIWTIWNPGWTVDDDEFGRTAASFDNPDWAAVVVPLVFLTEICLIFVA